MTELLLGQVLSFAGDPFTLGPDAARHESHGAVVIKDGKIAATGPADAMRAAYPHARVTDYGRALISAGFIDAHAHFPQTAMIASWGKRLIDWLNSYTFPEESRFGDPAYAQDVARRYFDLTLANGTTSTCSVCTIHPESVDAYFSAAALHGSAVAIPAGAAAARPGDSVVNMTQNITFETAMQAPDEIARAVRRQATWGLANARAQG